MARKLKETNGDLDIWRNVTRAGRAENLLIYKGGQCTCEGRAKGRFVIEPGECYRRRQRVGR